MKYFIIVVLFALSMCIVGCGKDENSVIVDTNKTVDVNDTNTTSDVIQVYETNNSLYNTRGIVPMNINFTSTISTNNSGAYVSSQCYTKTTDTKGGVHNPCFTCHIDSKEPNYINDWSLQSDNSFGDYTKVNRFTNLFKDRSAIVSQISDEEILSYVRENNYIQNGQILLVNRLNDVPSDWDINNDGNWSGYTPDCYFSFDNEGFDKAPDGNYTRWRAFGYYPFLGTFWPTNGSTDDTLIRLPKEFALDANSSFNLDVYKLNLSIVESLIKQKNVAIDATDESKYGIDLNQDGVLTTATEIVFKWDKPTYDSGSGKITNFSMSYAGLAKSLLASNEYLIAPGLYPKGTEFLHSVRYIDVDGQNVKMAPRMKELRYSKKVAWVNYSEMSNSALTEIKEKDAFPNRLRTITGNTEYGTLNNLGWVYQGFIEDAKGELRPQNYEETMFCIGCHSGIGSIVDGSFVFPRKFDNTHFQKGWYHWTQDANGLKNIKEPKTPDGRDEYSLYLEVNHAGDEFRGNDEVMNKFFDANGTLLQSQLDILKNDISYLLIPSAQRALNLDKAYKVIVEEQSYIYGRDAHITPITTVHDEINTQESNGIVTPIKYY